jgi:hypothetical protein
MQLQNPDVQQFSQHLKYINTSKRKSKVVPVHAMKGCRGSGNIALLTNLSIRWR